MQIWSFFGLGKDDQPTTFMSILFPRINATCLYIYIYIVKLNENEDMQLSFDIFNFNYKSIKFQIFCMQIRGLGIKLCLVIKNSMSNIGQTYKYNFD